MIEHFKSNCGTVSEVLECLVDKSKEIYGWDLDIHKTTIREVSKHEGKDKCIRFSVEFNLNPNKNVGGDRRVGDYIRERFPFLGVYWTSWCTFNELKAFKKCRIEFVLYFKDFPLVKQNYYKYLLQAEARTEYGKQKYEVRTESRAFVKNIKEYDDQSNVVDNLLKQLNREKAKLTAIENYHVGKYIELWESSAGSPPEVDYRLEGMFGV